MSDFYTKKQKKYWCDKCHIFIEYTKQSIEKHNQSKNHINNSSSGSRYDNMKKKFNKYVSDLNFIHNTEQIFLKNKKAREAIIESSNYFDEIKKEAIKEKIEKNIIKEEENVPKRKWAVFWDDNYKLPYYFNFNTGDSVWEKPEDYDGEQKEIDELVIEKTKANEGNIGEYQIVKEEESVFGKRKKSENEEEEDNTSNRDIKKKNNTVDEIIESTNKSVIKNNKEKEEIKEEEHKEKKPLEIKGDFKLEINLKKK